MERSTRAIDQLRPLCEQYGIRLAVENYREQSSVQRPVFYLERYPELMGFCLDIGHANLMDGETEDMRNYGEPLCALHLHDNDGTDDDHQPPYFGTVDWTACFSGSGILAISGRSTSN
ncbi:MAG: sugar phosphate isomerase/epimerase [Chloroflexota bacterium]